MLDGVDQSIFQAFGYDPPGYQGYDKAMDVYYLAIAYLSTLRNWTSRPAFRVARFLYFYRLVGVSAFELTEWRPLLLIFPNTFEYFFIAYEVVRLRRDPCALQHAVLGRRRGGDLGLRQAAAGVVDPHRPAGLHRRAGRCTRRSVRPSSSLLAVAAAAYWWLLRPRLSPPDWPLRIAADPVPAQAGTWQQRAAWLAAHGRAVSAATLEKVVLVGLIGVIYAAGPAGPGRHGASCSPASPCSSWPTPPSASGWPAAVAARTAPCWPSGCGWC